MAKNLLIVESPAKAKTIEKILGDDFEVKSCYGHIRDLEKDDMGIDLNNNYLPRYMVPEDKEKVVKELKQLAKKADEVWLASDEDREGESISWHLAEVLGLDPVNTKRIVFHEITAPAIKKAVATPRRINMDLVNAQQARRVLDRLVGFELSPVLWRKIGMQRSLSAGRVQSVAVRLIAEREREINAFKAESSYKVEAFFTAEDIHKKKVSFKADGPAKINSQQTAQQFLESCKGAAYKVADIQVKPAKRTPAAPFTTSTLQQEASRKLGYSVSKTMLLAQKLYESGKITYMRTDSVNLSDTAMGDIRNEVTHSYGNQYYQSRQYKNKNESAQEAHEAIRPTYMNAHTVDDADARRLYELIWKRTIASQMSDAEFEKTIAKISISTNKDLLTATGEVMKFDGFLKVYLEGKDEEEDEDDTEGMLPPLTTGQQLDFNRMTATEKFTRPGPRYTEASLVKKMEELGIGRPSTYAPTISTIMKRNYVEKRDKEGVKRDVNILELTKKDEIKKEVVQENTGAEKSKLFPTDLGLVVTDFLKQHFQKVMDYNFTARIEEEFDEIAGGKLKWNNMIDGFYKPFHSNIEVTLETAERAKGERELGVDAASGKKVIARMGRYGPMVQIGHADDEEKPRFAKLKASQSIETISYDEAMELFKLPRQLGEFEGSEVSVNIGRFGPYAAHDKKFYSLNKEMDPYSVTLEEIAPMIAEKRQAKDERTIKVFEKEKIQVLKGPYGPYIKQGLRNYKLSKEQQERAAELTIEEVKAIIEELKANPPKKVARKKKAK
ncbi:DNA topoisomerase-1 [Filimonas zeae]|uniref:DNA topoisomerase 1 n=1 Tax=Filimonas zeae TaxID=1737353 RepID=A0A917ISN2_9BACT|nr:type I DNA topoisomerase [Filimonas zeae]MDR6338276.1 DNA topoisomerase-1 [Filimonas zeae]GGH62602.1 DNA topoisomerase 1 [Filimonas zeae]